jgi:hypothetical protein
MTGRYSDVELNKALESVAGNRQIVAPDSGSLVNNGGVSWNPGNAGMVNFRDPSQALANALAEATKNQKAKGGDPNPPKSLNFLALAAIAAGAFVLMRKL